MKSCSACQIKHRYLQTHLQITPTVLCEVNTQNELKCGSKWMPMFFGSLCTYPNSIKFPIEEDMSVRPEESLYANGEIRAKRFDN